MSRRAAFLSSALVLFVSSPFAAPRRPPTAAESVRHAPIHYEPHVEKMADRYRLTLQASEPLPHTLIERNKKKIWFRLARPSLEGSQILEGDSVISEIRLVSRPYSADMVLKLGADAVSNDVYFDDGKKKLVVDIFTSVHAANKTTRKADSFTPKQQPAAVSRRAVVTVPSKGRAGQILTVVIDAGHGGMDSGAIGARGTLEKDINLLFAKDLAKHLSKAENLRVVMTRDRDEFIPLSQRTGMANNAGADLFISVHCNSSLSSRNAGFEAYFLSPDATDKAAESVARLENSVVALETHKSPSSSRLNELLASMAVGNYLNESSKFAALICRNIRTRTVLDRADTKEADFFVLRGAQMPSVLIELEYLSNPVSELKLRSSRYRSQLVKAVAEGVKSYDQQARLEHETVISQSRETFNTVQR